MENKKIKICHVASVDITVKFLLQSQLKFLINQGYDVSVVCSNGKWVDSIINEGIKVKTIKIKRKISPFYDLITLWNLYWYFKKEKFDIVHTHTPKPALLGQMAAKLAGVPIVINTIHGLYLGNKFSDFKKQFYIFIEKISDSFSDLIFSQNKEDILAMEKNKIADVQKVKYLGNGIDLEKFNKHKFSEEFIKNKKIELGVSLNSKVIGTVGRMVKEKGYLELFSAFKKVLERFPDALLLIAGPQDFEKKDAIKPEIARQFGIGSNILFLGERTDLDEIYPLIDIFVLASHREGFPRTIIEASAEELPVIATDIRGCREIIENKKTGILFPLGDSEKLAKLIIFILENSQFAKDLGKNARIKAEKEFDENLVFEKLKTEYNRLFEEKKLRNKKKFQLFLKRVFDVVISIMGLIVLSPLFLAVAVLIKIDSTGKVFFRQERIGKNGKPFYPFKFRTMIEGAENKGLGITTAKNDERITKIGKFLRKWAIDEFPQLINVLKGDMSLVGPRPTLKYQVEKYNNFQKKRLLVKPGLAGWALIHGRNLLSWEERIKYDVLYVENWSLRLDIKIIFLTFYLIFIKQEGVYAKNGANDSFE